MRATSTFTWICTALVIASLGTRAEAQTSQAKRPNFLFIYTDDQRWDAMGVVQKEHGDKARFPWLKTPNMDKLAAQGVRFRNAFVVNSLCAPSRASFLTGKYGHKNGIVNNHTPFPVDNVTWATLLRRAGYVTGYIGKWHMDGQKGQRPGFDFSASFIGQGKYVDCPIEVNGTPTETKGWVDDVSTDFAVKFMKDNKDKSFALAVGFKATHGPFDPPPRHANTYEGETNRPVPNLASKAIYRQGGEEPKKDTPKKKKAGKGPALGYFRCISAADDNLGKLMQALDDLGLTQDTIVIFASDNGYYLGEHGLGDKRTAYEESLRIPFLVRYPRLGNPGRTVDEMVLNVDLAPTFLDYAGVAIPKEVHGRSFRPLLEGKRVDWRKAWFYCYFFEKGFTQVPTVTAVRTESAVLIKYPGHDEWTEMFDLARDPYQSKNLAKDGGSALMRKELEAEYDKQSKAIDFRIPDFADKPGVAAAPPALKGWALEYDFTLGQLGDKIVDTSGRKNDGQAKGVILREGQGGKKKAAYFDGKSHIEVGKSASLNPAQSVWTVEVDMKADSPSAVILARGGKTNGYCLYLDEGRPAFAVTAANKTSRIAGKDTVLGAWTKLTARISAEQTLELRVNDSLAAQGKLHAYIGKDPVEPMQIGADLGTLVVDSPRLSGFVGLIERVRIHHGELP